MAADFVVWKPVRCLQDLDFDRKQLKVVQGKGKKDRTTFDSFDTRIKKYIAAEKPIDYL
jgi:hypothetical protein